MLKLLFLLVLSFPVYAENFYPFLTWTTPAGETGREDGSPLPSNEIKEYRIYQEMNYGNEDWIHVSSYNMVQSLEDQQYLRVITINRTTCFKLTTVDTEGRESTFSQETCYAWPNPPMTECLPPDCFIP